MSYYESYYGGPYSEPEPDEQQHCMMAGHPREINADTGWATCHCGFVTAPPYPEPHDGYSALHAELRDEYLSLVTPSAPYPEDAAVELGRKLSRETPETIRRLIQATKDTNPDYIDHSSQFSTLLTLGVHLDSTGRSLMHSVMRDMHAVNDSSIDVHHMNYAEGLRTPENIRVASVAARLYNKLEKDRSVADWEWGIHALNFVRDTYAALAERPEKMEQVVALYNSRPMSPVSTQLALALLRGEIEPVAPVISDGLL